MGRTVRCLRPYYIKGKSWVAYPEISNLHFTENEFESTQVTQA